MTLWFLLTACPEPKDLVVPADDTGAVATDDTNHSDDSTPPDLDQDDDGYSIPEDCDDTNANVNPGAAEVAGNGIDDNCDGINLPDADADGHGDADFGGDDCDDASAWVYPGATEYCDPIDQDCDGEPLVAGGCAGLQEPTAWASFVNTGPPYMRTARDVSGDGRSDLVFGNGADTMTVGSEAIYPAYALYDVASLSTLPLAPPDGAVQVLTAPTGRVSGPIDAGDVTGDGEPDFVIVGTFVYQAFVIPGPMPLDGSVLDGGDSGFSWVPDFAYSESWCQGVVLGGDFDGDGVNDLLCDSSAFYGEEPDGLVQFFRGGDFGAETTQAAFLGQYIFTPGLLPDLTGDGINEVSVLETGLRDLRIVDGAELAAGGEVGAGALATADFSVERYGYAAVEDRTGDGVADLFVTDNDADFLGYQHGAVYLFDGTSRGTLAPDAAVGCWVGSEDGPLVFSGKDVDFNGDGVMETWLTVDTDAESQTLITPVVVPTWAEDPTTWALRWDRAYSLNDAVPLDASPGDDPTFYNYDADQADLYLYSGWDVPWFDPVYWPQ